MQRVSRPRKREIKDVQLCDLVSQHESRDKPYKAGDIQRFRICTPEDHQGNAKNCASNPHCLYGLGERKDGVWNTKQPLLKGLGDDPAGLIRGYKPRRTSRDSGGSSNGAAWGGKRKRVHRAAVEDDDEDDEKWKEVPAGLMNLGATCYLNVLLQLMFFNRRLRQAVYMFRPPDRITDRTAKMVEIMEELQSVFGHMQSCKQNSHHPGRFAKLLCLQRGEQQDPVEFNRLFIQKIDDCFRDLSLGSVVKEMFRGKNKWVTRCSACGYESGREETFDEVDLSLEGHNSVRSCLQGYLQSEMLVGDNKYLCGRCNSKQEAIRRNLLTSLPPVLNIHLIRYVFDQFTYEKKKVKDLIFLDETLDFADIIKASTTDTHPPASIAAPGSGSGGGEHEIYDLVAALHHKGGSASHGHYTAEIKDTETGKWWFFDDVDVKPVKAPNQHQSGSSSSSKGADKGGANSKPPSSSSSTRASSKQQQQSNEMDVVVLVDSDAEEEGSQVTGGNPKQQPQTITLEEDEEGEEAQKMEVVTNGPTKRKRDANGACAAAEGTAPSAPASGGGGGGGGGKGSSDAYYLVYVKRGTVFPKEAELEPPPQVMAKAQEANRKLDSLVSDFKKKKAELENQVVERRAMYERLFGSETPPLAAGDQYAWIPTHWLRCWVTGLHLPKETDAAASSKGGGKKKAGGGGAGDPEDGEVVDMTGDDEDGATATAAAGSKGSDGDDDGDDDDDDSKANHLEGLPQTSVFCEPLELQEYRCRCCAAGSGSRTRMVDVKLDPEKTSDLKVVRLEVWYTLLEEISKRYPAACEEHGAADVAFQGEEGLGGSGLPSYYCKQCVVALLQKQTERQQKTARTDQLMKALQEPEPSTTTGAGVYLLSRKWEQAFKKDYERKKKVLRDGQTTLDKLWASPAKAAAGHDNDEDSQDTYIRPNLSITCVHDKLCGSVRAYRAVSKSCWLLLSNLFDKAIPHEAHDMPCEECKAEQQKENDEKKAKKEAREHEIKNKALKALFKRKVPYPPALKQDLEQPTEHAGLRYKLVPQAWLNAWRAYVADLSQARPRRPSVEALLCQHGKAMLPKFITDIETMGELPKLSESEWLEGKEGEVGGDLLTLEEWDQLMAVYPGEGGIDLRDDDDDDDDDSNSGGKTKTTNKPDAAGEIDVIFTKVVDQASNSMAVRVASKPSSCQECMHNRSADHERRQVDYRGVRMKLIMLKVGQEPPPPPVAAAAAAATTNGGGGANALVAAAVAAGKRRSARGASKTRSGETHMIPSVDCTDSLSTFKLKAWQVIQFEEGKNIIVYHEGQELVDKHRTLSSYGVRADATLYAKLFDAPEGQGVFEEGDFPVDPHHEGGGSSGYREQGFQGTFLAQSHTPVKAEGTTACSSTTPGSGGGGGGGGSAAAQAAGDKASGTGQQQQGEEEEEGEEEGGAIKVEDVEAAPPPQQQQQEQQQSPPLPPPKQQEHSSTGGEEPPSSVVVHENGLVGFSPRLRTTTTATMTSPPPPPSSSGGGSRASRRSMEGVEGARGLMMLSMAPQRHHHHPQHQHNIMSIPATSRQGPAGSNHIDDGDVVGDGGRRGRRSMTTMMMMDHESLMLKQQQQPAFMCNHHHHHHHHHHEDRTITSLVSAHYDDDDTA